MWLNNLVSMGSERERWCCRVGRRLACWRFSRLGPASQAQVWTVDSCTIKQPKRTSKDRIVFNLRPCQRQGRRSFSASQSHRTWALGGRECYRRRLPGAAAPHRCYGVPPLLGGLLSLLFSPSPRSLRIADAGRVAPRWSLWAFWRIRG